MRRPACSCMLHVACCMLHAACCMLHACMLACLHACMLACLHVACCMLHASGMFSVVTPFFFRTSHVRMLHVVCRKLHVASCTSHGARRMLHASGMLSVKPVILFLHVALQIPDACNMRHATCSMRHATCNMQTCDDQHATCNMRHATSDALSLSLYMFTCQHAHMQHATGRRIGQLDIRPQHARLPWRAQWRRQRVGSVHAPKW